MKDLSEPISFRVTLQNSVVYLIARSMADAILTAQELWPKERVVRACVDPQWE